MSTERKNRPRGLTFPQALVLLFTGLKLTGHIDWPWKKVLWPMWVSVGAATALPYLEKAQARIEAEKATSGAIRREERQAWRAGR